MVEVKGGDKLNNSNDIAKSNKAVIFCEVASNWSKANGRKQWKYIFISSKEINISLTFEKLSERFIKK